VLHAEMLSLCHAVECSAQHHKKRVRGAEKPRLLI
jgi:hypothetical protein